jgi:hypothetical protein
MMQRVKLPTLVLLAAISLWFVSGAASASPSTRPSGVAVVELFTSEGCSSCPPAETVLGDLARAAERDGRPVLALAFHVDYWNHLGWADRFSDAAYSHRQEWYAKVIGFDQLYTPQMVVNGRAQFVGSNREQADRAIAEALAAESAAMTVAVSRNTSDGYVVHASVAGVQAGLVVNVAVVEQGLSTDVKSGENGGHRLQEPSVVRWFKTIPASDAGNVVLPALAGVRRNHASVVVYAQRADNGLILGAAAASLP